MVSEGSDTKSETHLVVLDWFQRGLQSMLKLKHEFLTEQTLSFNATLSAGVRGFRGSTCISEESSGGHL